MKYSVNVNGQTYQVEVRPDTPLLWILRDVLELKGTKFGCGKGLCGSCTVHVNGEATRSCSLPISEVGHSKVITIEGITQSTNVNENPVFQAWIQEDVAQCGYCQPGQVMLALSFLSKNTNPTEDEINNEMFNLCRCGSYPAMKRAIKRAAERMS